MVAPGRSGPGCGRSRSTASASPGGRDAFAAQTTRLPDLDSALDQLEDPASDLSRRWDREHDEFVLHRLLDLIEPEFRPATWQAFRRQVIDGAPAEMVAAELGLTVNAVLIAKSRVLSHLRRNAEGLVD